jgi:ribosomal protein S18 acetylase RimI-like enzyme
MSTVKIRMVGLDDIDSLHSIIKECFSTDHYLRFFISEACEAFADTFLVAEGVEIITKEVVIRPGVTINSCADIKKFVVGYLLAIPGGRITNTVRILSIAVIPSERKKGIGGKLLAVLEKQLRYKGINAAIVALSDGDKYAVTFFEKQGFEKESIHHGDISRSLLKKKYDYSDRAKRKVHIRKLIDHIKKLYAEDRLKILDAIVESGGNDKSFLRAAYDSVLKAYNMQLGGKKSLDVKIIENWMEKHIRNSSTPHKLTPVRLAYEYRHYYRWPEKMDPFLRTVARRVKDKLYRRAKQAKI